MERWKGCDVHKYQKGGFTLSVVADNADFDVQTAEKLSFFVDNLQTNGWSQTIIPAVKPPVRKRAPVHVPPGACERFMLLELD